MTELSDDDRLYLDDLHIGQRFTSGTQVVDEEQIKAFARQFDPQPFHLDNEVAKDILFSGLVGSGWHTAAITMRLLVEGGLPLAGGIIGAGGELEIAKAELGLRRSPAYAFCSRAPGCTPARCGRMRMRATMIAARMPEAT
jgi:hypothetical protein